MKFTFSALLCLCFYVLPVSALDYSLDFRGEGASEILKIKGKDQIKAPMHKVLLIMKDVPAYKELTHYLIKSQWDEENKIASFKLCYFFLCSAPKVLMNWQERRLDWRYISGQFKGSSGHILFSQNNEDVEMQFESNYKLGGTVIPKWIIRKVSTSITEGSLKLLKEKMENPKIENSKD